jgi:hypothetical protein
MALSNETLHILRRLLPRRAVDILAAELSGGGDSAWAVVDDIANLDSTTANSTWVADATGIGGVWTVGDDQGSGAYIEVVQKAGASPTGRLLESFITDEANDRFTIDRSGLHRWGDGTNPPDVTLQRANTPSPGLALNGYLDATPGGFYTADSESSTTKDLSLSPGRIALQAENGPGTAFSLGRYSEADYRLLIDREGAMRWGDGTNPPDVSLRRLGAGNVGVATPIDAHTVVYTFLDQAENAFVSEERVDGNAVAGIYAYGDGSIQVWPPDSTRGGFLLQQWNDANPRILVSPDGDFRWGDGTNPPDATLSRRVVAGKVQLVANVGGTEVVLAAQA